MALLLCSTYPFLEIYVPHDGTYRKFQAGKLEIDEEDPAYPIVMEEASRNPAIVIFTSGTQCSRCGEVFGGSTGKAQLAKHTKDVHFEDWVAARQDETATMINREIKRRSGFACDACKPAQIFDTPELLAEHLSVVHMQPPAMDAEGNELGKRDEEGGDTTVEIPAATPK